MADPRNFAKIDLGYFDNPKVSDFVDERPRVPLLHLRAILYCRQHLTDGTFPIRAVVRLACASYCGSQCDGQCDFCAAVHARLFDRIDDRSGYVHDYLEHQDSAEQAMKRKEAGRRAAEARWGKSEGADGNADGNANRNADSNTEKRREEKTRESASRARRSPERPIPGDWRPNAGHQEYADEHGIDLSTEAFKFRNHAIANDRRQRDWDASFRVWLGKSRDFTPAKAKPRAAGIPEGW